MNLTPRTPRTVPAAFAAVASQIKDLQTTLRGLRSRVDTIDAAPKTYVLTGLPPDGIGRAGDLAVVITETDVCICGPRTAAGWPAPRYVEVR